MKRNLFLVLSLILSFSSFAKGDLTSCVTQGDCFAFKAPKAIDSTSCYIVKTGVDSQGVQQCNLRCYTRTVTLGNICYPISGKNFGFCEQEKDPANDRPIYSEYDPNRCDNAVNSSDVFPF